MLGPECPPTPSLWVGGLRVVPYIDKYWPNIDKKWLKHTFFKRRMSKRKKTPAASLKRRNNGLGLPIHIKKVPILLNIRYYIYITYILAYYISIISNCLLEYVILPLIFAVWIARAQEALSMVIWIFSHISNIFIWIGNPNPCLRRFRLAEGAFSFFVDMRLLKKVYLSKTAA